MTLEMPVRRDDGAIAPRAAGGAWPFDADFARDAGVLCSPGDGDRMRVAVREGADPAPALLLQRQFANGLAIETLDAHAFDLRVVARGDGDAPSSGSGGDRAAAADRLVAALVREAAQRGASAIHFEPHSGGIAVRMRVDSTLVAVAALAPDMADPLAAAVRRVAKLSAQDTRFAECGATARVSLALTTLSTQAGERMVLRRADSGAGDLALAGLGMAPVVRRLATRATAGGGGILLVAGPRGSGVTTTLHTLVRTLARATRNVLTVEARCEGDLDTVARVVADPHREGSIAEAVRAVLAQDPDAIMIGAIADRESVRAAIDAARAGHLVLAGIEASDSVGALLALRAMKVDPFGLAATLDLVIAQRLVRRLCAECRRPVQAQGSVSALLGFDPGAIVYAAQGCGACGDTGFDGQTGVFEAIGVDATIRRLIADGGDAAILARHAFVNAPNLGSAARALVRDGITTPNDAVAITRGPPGAEAR